MYKINTIELNKVVGANGKIPMHSMKEFVLVGRSNVGKSSFINAVAGRKNYAHTSSTPGKTRTINYYLINNKFYFVDLPGYGFAKASKSEQNKWADIINDFLQKSSSIEEIIMLVDIRHAPSNDDLQMFAFIYNNTGYEPIVIATKADKLKKNEINKNIEIIRNDFSASPECLIIPFSMITKDGVKDFLNVLEKVV